MTLNFRGINYSAEVYLNGHKEVLPKGMFRRHTIDITGILHPDGNYLLAVLVHPPDHPGAIPPQGGQGGDHEVSHILSPFFPWKMVSHQHCEVQKFTILAKLNKIRVTYWPMSFFPLRVTVFEEFSCLISCITDCTLLEL